MAVSMERSVCVSDAVLAGRSEKTVPLMLAVYSRTSGKHCERAEMKFVVNGAYRPNGRAAFVQRASHGPRPVSPVTERLNLLASSKDSKIKVLCAELMRLSQHRPLDEG